MYKSTIYISPELGLSVKQFTNGNIVWIIGKRKSVKTKIKVRMLGTKLKKKYNYIEFVEMWIDEVHKYYKMITKKEEKKEREWKNWMKRTFKKGIRNLTAGYKAYLRVRGVGYKFEIKRNNIMEIDIGYSYKLEIKIPKKYKIGFSKKKTKIKLRGANMQKLMLFIGEIRKMRLPDVYKGKGIRFLRDKHQQREGKIKK